MSTSSRVAVVDGVAERDWNVKEVFGWAIVASVRDYLTGL
jgi:hypothetical protein